MKIFAKNMNILELRIAEKDKKYRLQLIPFAPSDAPLLRTELYVYNGLFCERRRCVVVAFANSMNCKAIYTVWQIGPWRCFSSLNLLIIHLNFILCPCEFERQVLKPFRGD